MSERPANVMIALVECEWRAEVRAAKQLEKKQKLQFMLGNLTVVTCSEIVRFAPVQITSSRWMCTVVRIISHIISFGHRLERTKKSKRNFVKWRKTSHNYSLFVCFCIVFVSVAYCMFSGTSPNKCALPQCERSRPAASGRLCVRFLCNKNGNIISRRNHLHSLLVCVRARASKWNFISFNNTKRSFSCRCLLPVALVYRPLVACKNTHLNWVECGTENIHVLQRVK